MKRGLFILIFLVSINLASALEINLSKDIYSNNVNFQGDLFIEESNVDVTSVVKGDVRECGTYAEKKIELYDLLIASGFDLGPKEIFVAGASSEVYNVALGDNQSELVGLLINGDLNQLNFSVSGSGSGFYIDVGVDGVEDWRYIGGFSQWGDIVDSQEYDGSYDLTNVYEVDPHDQKCSEINISFDEMVGDLFVQIETFAKGGGVDDQLVARIGGQTCTLEGTGNNDWGLAKCNISLDATRYDSPRIFDVCIWSSSSNFRIPSRVGTDFYFTRLRQAEYNENLGNKIFVSDSNLINAVNTYYNECDEDWCLIPMRLRLENIGQVNLDDLFARSLSGGEFRVFHTVDSETIKLNLSDDPISLSAFSSLKTPDVEEDVCILRMSFDGEYDEVSFEVNAGPTPVIEVSSRYMAKGFPVEFDGSNSIVRNNRSITSWNWNFGDGTTGSGSVVSHTYNSYGNYSVSLSVRDSSGAESNTSLAIHIVPLEEHLTSEFLMLDDKFSNAKLNAFALKDKVFEFHEFMGYGNVIEAGEERTDELEINFTAVKNSAIVDKETQYAKIANELHSILRNLPLTYVKKGSKDIKNLLLTGSEDVFDYGGEGGYSPAYADAIYSFNRDNVDVNSDSTLIGVEFFEGKSDYLYVKKSLEVAGGNNKVVVEDLRETVETLDNVFGGTKENYSKVIIWDMPGSTLDLEYVVKTNDLETINTVVYSNVDVTGEELYCFDDPSCDKYCGDSVCTIANYLGVDESSESNNNYCPGDCVLDNSMTKYIVLFIIFFVFIIYLLFYKGPGSVKDIMNKMSYGVSGKKVFLTERDKIALKNYVDLSLRRGFNKSQIHEALIKKGWKKEQVEEIMKKSLKK